MQTPDVLKLLPVSYYCWMRWDGEKLVEEYPFMDMTFNDMATASSWKAKICPDTTLVLVHVNRESVMVERVEAS